MASPRFPATLRHLVDLTRETLPPMHPAGRPFVVAGAVAMMGVAVLATADRSTVETLHRSEFSTRWVYKEEMALLLRIAGFERWEIYGGFDRRPLEQETDAMVVMAWEGGG